MLHFGMGAPFQEAEPHVHSADYLTPLNQLNQITNDSTSKNVHDNTLLMLSGNIVYIHYLFIHQYRLIKQLCTLINAYICLQP